jgi:predicted ATP-grasp superfamily ATP-dependent carboligase
MVPDTVHLVEEVTPGSTRVLVHSLTGFLDAGMAAQVASTHLLAHLEHEIVATFDADALLDYRARRPRMIYDTDHFDSVTIPKIVVHRMRDLAGAPFLLLTGPEPDYRWQAFVDAVAWLVDRWQVPMTVGLSGVPWPSPHTRPTAVTLHGSDRSLTAESVPLVGRIEVPGHVGGLLELTLGQRGERAMGIATHVPHYLAQVEFPRAAIAMLEALSRMTGLVLPTEGLAAAADRADIEIAAQLEGNEEFGVAVRALEEQYDAIMAIQSSDIASQVERFLASRAAEEEQG